MCFYFPKLKAFQKVWPVYPTVHINYKGDRDQYKNSHCVNYYLGIFYIDCWNTEGSNICEEKPGSLTIETLNYFEIVYPGGIIHLSNHELTSENISPVVYEVPFLVSRCSRSLRPQS